MAQRSVSVRVVPIAEQRLLGWIVGVAGGLGVIMTTMEPFGIHTHADARYTLIGLALAVWNVGMLMAWRPAPFSATARADTGLLLVEPKRVGASRALVVDENTQVTVAKATRGYVVGLLGTDPRGGTMKEPLFVEVETESDARALLSMVGVPWPGRGSIGVVHRREILCVVQRTAAVLGAIGGLLYFFLVGVMQLHDYKPIGILGLAGLLSSALYVFDALLRRKVTIGDEASGLGHAFGALGRHFALHAMARLDAKEPARASTTDAEPRVRIFLRGDETTHDWLTRLDAMGAAGAGYRGDVASREELLAIVDDASLDPLARTGAARVLVKKYGLNPSEVSARVDASLATRVRIAVEGEATEAADAMDAMGPDLKVAMLRR